MVTAEVQSATGVRKVMFRANENIGTGARSANVTIFVQDLPQRIIDFFLKEAYEEKQEFCIFDAQVHN